MSQQSLAGEALASTRPAKPRPIRGRRPPAILDGKQFAAVFRIKPLRRLHCCALPVLCWGGVGASGPLSFTVFVVCLYFMAIIIALIDVNLN